MILLIDQINGRNNNLVQPTRNGPIRATQVLLTHSLNPIRLELLLVRAFPLEFHRLKVPVGLSLVGLLMWQYLNRPVLVLVAWWPVEGHLWFLVGGLWGGFVGLGWGQKGRFVWGYPLEPSGWLLGDAALVRAERVNLLWIRTLLPLLLFPDHLIGLILILIRTYPHKRHLRGQYRFLSIKNQLYPDILKRRIVESTLGLTSQVAFEMLLVVGPENLRRVVSFLVSVGRS